MRLENKVAIVTGGGTGIGKEIAIRFAKEGAKVAITGRKVEPLMRTCNEINGQGEEKAIYVQGDVTIREDMDKLVNETVKRFGKVDILINNAGINKDALITKMTDEEWNAVLKIDLTGAFNCIKAVIDTMINQGSGVIISASSISGEFGNIGQANYSAAKAGLIGMTKALAKELGRKGIRVNAVAPGFIKTRMTERMPEKIKNMVIERTPLRRMGETIDVANAYLYLASDEANFINGAVLDVDGGLTL